MSDNTPVLEVKNLTVRLPRNADRENALENVNLVVHPKEVLCMVGESGSGKSVTSYAVMRILDRAGRIAGGSIVFGGIGIDKAPEKVMTELRGREMSMVFQNPRAALNPIRAIGRQIEDVLIEHALAVRAMAPTASA